MSEQTKRKAAEWVRALERSLEAASLEAETKGDNALADALAELVDAIADARQLWQCDHDISAGQDLDRR